MDEVAKGQDAGNGLKTHGITRLVAALFLGMGTHACETRAEGVDPPPRVIADLVADLDHWLDERCSYDHPDDEGPSIGFIDVGTELMVGGALCEVTDDMRGFYDPDRLKVFLVRPWSPEDTFDISVLLHELVHYRQEEYDWRCVGEMERPAYRLQEEWLEEQGVDAGFNWVAIYLLSRCPGSSPHPE